jgi:glycosyltransferase involved in cell wall biosynthesis
MPRVSVILTSYNHGKYVEEAIGSVLAQTFDDFELIIWDDASTDDSWHRIGQIADLRVKAFRNAERKRAVWGVNHAIARVASGRYIAIHHSDDVWEPAKLEKQVDFLDRRPDIGAVFTDALAIDGAGNPMLDTAHFYFNAFEQPSRTRHEWLRFFFGANNALCHPSVLIRKSCFEDCGRYRFGFAQIGDMDMWVRLCMRYEIHVLPEKLVRFRVLDNDANSSADTPQTRVRAAFEFYKLLQNYREFSTFEDLTLALPNAVTFYRGREADAEFALANVALEEVSAITQLFGLDLLFEIISEPGRAARIKRLYGFDHKCFVALAADHDVFRVRALAALGNEIECLKGRIVDLADQNACLGTALAARDAQVAMLADQRDILLNSRSWRVTAPLRYLRRRTGDLLRL